MGRKRTSVICARKHMHEWTCERSWATKVLISEEDCDVLNWGK